MKQERLKRLIYVIILGGILVIPFVFANREQGQISETENRYKADLPTAQFGTEEYAEQLEAWLDDNLALRETFLRIRSYILYKGLNIVSSEKVERGEDGWLFYSTESNLEIAKGEYILNGEELENIAETQQAISEYYKSMGKTYVLCLVPSRVSVYPEYLYGDYSVIETPCDVVYDYLRENTDVIVVNSKEDLLANKSEGELAWKADTHFNTLGYYYVYQGMLNVLNSENVGYFMVTPLTKTRDVYTPNLYDMLGCSNISEESDGIDIDFSSKQVLDGAYYNALQGIREEYLSIKDLYIFENTSIEEQKTILVYGTSHIELVRKMPQLLGENFSMVTCVRTDVPSPNYDVDSISNADIVVNVVGERAIRDVLRYWSGDLRVKLPEVAIKKHTNENSILYVDSCNDMNVSGNPQGLQEAIAQDSTRCVLSGWAADLEKLTGFSNIYIKVGEHILKGTYGYSRQDVGQAYETDKMNNVGYRFDFSSKYLYEDDGSIVDSLEFYGLSVDSTYMYGPIKVSLGGVE